MAIFNSYVKLPEGNLMNGKGSMLAHSHVDDQIVACTSPIINVVETLRFKFRGW